MFDAKWSPLSDLLAATDSHGHLSLFGFGGDDNYKKVPSEQFFHTDYRPLMRDQNDYVIDEQTQTPPHLMPPAFLVNADGHPYSIDFQRLVPGRENLSDLQLNPHVVVNDRGQPEIIGDLDSEDIEVNVTSDDNTVRTQNRRRNLWKKNVIPPLDAVALRTDEEHRINKQKVEDEYITTEYHKGGDNDNHETNGKFQSKRGRGRGKMPKRPNDSSSAPEVVCKNRLAAKALYDTDGEEEVAERNSDEDGIENDEYVEIVDDDDDDDDNDDDDDDEDSKQPVATRSSNGLNNRNRVYVSQELQINSDESSDSSEYSDWAEEEGNRTLLPPPSRTRKEKRGRRRIKIKDDDEDVEVDVEADEESSTTKITRKVRKAARVIHDDDEDEEMTKTNEEDMNDVKPSTSTDVSPRKGRPPKRNQQIKTEKVEVASAKKRKSISKQQILKDKKDYKECPPQYRPPDWLTSTKPRKSPYAPQIGDVVVYFRQGHEIYIETVRRDNTYELDDRSLPWLENVNIKIIEYCKVVGLRIEIKPPRLVCLKLNVIDPLTDKCTGTHFSIKYHDMAGVVDFVILKQIFERGEEREWRPKDRFRCIIDDAWWIGMIESREPFDINYPDSPFQCYNVLWDSDEREKLSSWDLEPMHMKKSKQSNKGDSFDVSNEELISLIYTPDQYEWPSCGRDSECERILAGLEKIMELSIAEYFNYPVDLDAYPLYAIIIGYPIDLNTIKQRLENRYYRRVNSIQWDVRIIERNAVNFNEKKSDIVRQAALLTDILLEFIVYV